MSHNPQHTEAPKHRDNWRPVDAPSRALILPPVWPVEGEGWSIVGGRHRYWGQNAGTIVEEILSHPRTQRGSAASGAVLILTAFASFLFALTVMFK